MMEFMSLGVLSSDFYLTVDMTKESIIWNEKWWNVRWFMDIDLKNNTVVRDNF